VVASALDYRGPRHVVVASGAEFPTVGHAWLAQRPLGAVVRWVPARDGVLAPADYEPVIDERTVVVSAAHAWYLNGTLQDIPSLARLAHERGALLYVDAYQSAGIVPIDVKAMEVDFLAAGTLKFLMGTPGIAFLYVRRDLIDRLEPRITGWFGRANPYAFDAERLDWSPTASRFEAGTPSVFSAYVSRAGMAMLRGTGMGAVAARGQELAALLEREGDRLGLAMHGRNAPFGRTTTTGFLCDDAAAAERALRARGIIASARGPVVRLAPHFYSTAADVDAALRALREVVRH
jgi:selenocysteine lyase/cysteine desulfurase